MRIKLSGKVFTGKGEGRLFVGYTWVKHEIEEKLGFTPYAGTLNLKLSAESIPQRKVLEASADLRICASEGGCSGLLSKAQIGTLECGIIIPNIENYPHDVLEIIAWAYLRERLKLRDGDNVAVKVTF